MMKRVFLFLFALVISGCSMFSKTEEPVKEMAVAPVKNDPVSVAIANTGVKREPGSIWTEHSRWNDLYSVYTGRGMGDVVILKPTDTFKLQIAKAGGRTFDPTQISRENSNIVAQIKEVLPRQVYVLQSKQNIRVGTRDHRIELTAKMREQDIGADDSASTEQLFDVGLVVAGDDPQVTEDKKLVAAEKPVEKQAEKTSEKGEPAKEVISDDIKTGGVKETKKEKKK